ncbi:MAG: TetR/AcrR family transcriptional regulator [Oscillospiraceae bacterium]|nr:TetR/AcrR family transcriptional regulator [Oscillospiraceae bacterium]
MSRISKAPEERRQELIEAAGTLFRTQGYERTMVSDIVRQVGVAQGLFYYYFESKQDIFRAVMDQFIGVKLEQLAGMLREASVSPLKRIHQVLQVVAGFLREMEDFRPHTEGGMDSEMYLRLHTHVMEMMEPFVTQVLGEGNLQGVLDAPYPQHMARFMLSGFVGVESMPGAPQSAEMMTLVLRMMERLLRLPQDTLHMEEGGEDG